MNCVRKIFLAYINRSIIKKLGGYAMEKILVKIIETAIKQMSPQLRAAIKELIVKLDQVAKTTPNPWDDLLVMFAKAIFESE